MAHTNDGSKGGELKGNSHDNGGIPAIVKGNGNQPVELEGNELIVNKKSAQSDEIVTVTGTPKEVVSAVNSMDGNGVVIDSGATLTRENGQVQKMAHGGEVLGYSFKDITNISHEDLKKEEIFS